MHDKMYSCKGMFQNLSLWYYPNICESCGDFVSFYTDKVKLKLISEWAIFLITIIHVYKQHLSESFHALIGIGVGFLPSCAREFHGHSKIIKWVNGMEMIVNCSSEFLISDFLKCTVAKRSEGTKYNFALFLTFVLLHAKDGCK